MTTREKAPIGSPCWTDLWTSDVAGSARFYGELFGWEAQEPSPEFGGYFMFTRDGVPVAGGMGDMGEMKADNTWKIYLASDDIAKTLELAEAGGAEILGPAMASPTWAPRLCRRPGGRRPRHVAARDIPRLQRPRRARALLAGSSCSRGTTPAPSPSISRRSIGILR